jgi:hypothetical protein
MTLMHNSLHDFLVTPRSLTLSLKLDNILHCTHLVSSHLLCAAALNRTHRLEEVFEVCRLPLSIYMLSSIPDARAAPLLFDRNHHNP